MASSIAITANCTASAGCPTMCICWYPCQPHCFVKELKVSSSKWMKANPHFPKFTGWSQEYAGFTYSIHDRDKIINYIKGQKEHHKKMTFAEEYRRFIEANEVAIDNRFFMKDA